MNIIRKNVLVAEDEHLYRESLRLKLEDAGFSVFETSSGKKALRYALHDKPDAILLDLALPEIDGEEVLKKLREDAWGKTVPIIVLTNLPSPKDIESVKRASAFLSKANVSLDDVAEEVRKQLAIKGK